MNSINSPRLRLIPCNLEMLNAGIAGDKELAQLTGFEIPSNWSEFKEMSLPYVKEKLHKAPQDAAWWTYFPVLKAGNVLIGTCGFKGAPDANGQVEIGYEVAPAYRGKGFAKEIANALTAHAFAQPQVSSVSAHTLAEENASVQVLRHAGLSFEEAIQDSEDGAIWAWRTERPPLVSGQIPNSRETDYEKGMESERLISRPLELSDAAAWANFIANEEATKFLPLKEGKSAEELAFLWMQKQKGRYATGIFGLQALIDKKTGDFVGQCGLLGQIVEEKWELEVGYHIFPQHWRKGYATEAAKAWMNWANDRGIGEGIISLIDVANTNSQAVARKNGLSPDFRTKMMGLDIQVFRV